MLEKIPRYARNDSFRSVAACWWSYVHALAVDRNTMVVGELTEQTDVLVIGGGPGGYVAAFRAADLGLQTTLDGRECAARRRVPARRLHPVQGAAARGAPRSRLRPRPKAWGVKFTKPRRSMSRSSAAGSSSVVEKLCGGVKPARQGPRCQRDPAPGPMFEDSRTVRSRRRGSRPAEVQALRFIASGSRVKRTLPEQVLPADLLHRFQRRAGSGGHPQDALRDRRRLYRARARPGLRVARQRRSRSSRCPRPVSLTGCGSTIIARPLVKPPQAAVRGDPHQGRSSKVRRRPASRSS